MTNYIEVHKGSIAWREDELRPEWLGDGDIAAIHEQDSGWCGTGLNRTADAWEWHGDIDVIRIPDTHWSAPALKDGWRPWAGGDAAPQDWDGGKVLLRFGHPSSPPVKWWSHTDRDFDVVGYKPKPTKPECQVSPELVEWPEGLTPETADRLIGVAQNIAARHSFLAPVGDWVVAEARAILADMQPDPLVEAARKICAEIEGDNKGYQYLDGSRDDYPSMRIAIAGIKHGLTITKEAQP